MAGMFVEVGKFVEVELGRLVEVELGILVELGVGTVVEAGMTAAAGTVAALVVLLELVQSSEGIFVLEGVV